MHYRPMLYSIMFDDQKMDIMIRTRVCPCVATLDYQGQSSSGWSQHPWCLLLGTHTQTASPESQRPGEVEEGGEITLRFCKIVLFYDFHFNFNLWLVFSPSVPSHSDSLPVPRSPPLFSLVHHPSLSLSLSGYFQWARPSRTTWAES